VLSIGLASLDVSNVGAQNNVAASLSVPIEWPSKRPARIAAANANLKVVNADLEDFMRVLHAVAATAWVDAVFAERVLLRKKQTAAGLAELADLNAERQREGAASELALLQSRLEARRAQSEVSLAEGEVLATRLALQELLGVSEGAPPTATGELQLTPHTFDASQVIARALESRPDVRARTLGTNAADAQLQLARANRGVDLSVTLGWLYYTAGAQGSAYQGPPYHTVNAMLSAPLPFSRVYDGEVQSARAGQRQAEAQRAATVVRVTVEIRSALARYEAARARLGQFDDQLLADSDRMLEMARYSYAQGASRLMDLLSAQRTWTETSLAREAALADHARALIALETALNTWDL
jgi:outer membrane protein, heavy metal efflux system